MLKGIVRSVDDGESTEPTEPIKISFWNDSKWFFVFSSQVVFLKWQIFRKLLRRLPKLQLDLFVFYSDSDAGFALWRVVISFIRATGFLYQVLSSQWLIWCVVLKTYNLNPKRKLKNFNLIPEVCNEQIQFQLLYRRIIKLIEFCWCHRTKSTYCHKLIETETHFAFTLVI